MAELSTSQVFGDLTVTGLTKTSVLQSLIGTGTAPLIIASTTLVNNLNADLLDGFHGAVDAATDTYVLRGSSLANIQAIGLSSAWGVTNGTATGGLNVVMGTGSSATWLISGTSNGVFRCGIQTTNDGTGTRIYSGAFWLSIGSDGLITSSSGFSGSLTGNASTATKLQTARTIAISGDGVGTATSFDGSANITIPFTLANVATAGTYRSVTVNEKGLVTAGTNPTTLSGYGITDAAPSSHVGTNGAAHAVVTTSVNGFMSAVDKVNLDKVPLLGQGLRNSFLCDGGQLNWGITANVFSWSKAYNIYPAQGTLLLNGLPFKKLTIAASSVTLPSAGHCAYITVPTAYSDAPNLVGTCTMSVADATTVSGTDKIILYVRDADSCLQGWDGWIVYGTIVQAGGKRDAYVENLYTAASDFIVGVGSRTFAKKTLAETKTILGINSATTGATGVVQLATQTEVTAGADKAKAVTPDTLKVELDKKLDDTQLSIDVAMTSNSDTLIPSQKATKNYVDTAVANLINSSPAALNTLDKLAAALGDDANFATTMTNTLANKVDKSIFTAENDFVLGSGVGTFAKKTLAEVRTILQDASNRFITDTEKSTWNGKLDKSLFTALNDFLIGTGAGTYAKKTLAEIRDLIIPTGLTCYIHGTTPLAGFIKKNGTLLSRTTYANLWAYAQSSGNIVNDTTWNAGAYGSFSTGDGSTTFRIPDDRGYFDRAWDDGRGIDSGRAIGTSQADDTKSHTHTATSAEAGAHAHTTNSSGAHTHTYSTRSSAGGTSGGSDAGGAGYTANTTSSAGAHIHTTDFQGAHTHTITVNATGGTETRGKNIAKLAIIKY